MSEPIRRGVIRVDAARAAEKIREHLLAEPESWLAEVVRAASLEGATRIDVMYDADDLYVSFDGEPWPAPIIERLETCVVADGATPRSARLLAVGVFAALGHEARSIDVLARAPDGTIASRRYERSRGDAAATSRADLDVELEERLVPGKTVLLHVRRGPSFAVLARFVARLVGEAAPPEVVLLRERWTADAVPVFVDGEPLVELHAPAVVTSVVVAEGPPTVRLELVANATAAPSIELRELGVILGHAPWRTSWMTERTADGLFTPLRVVVSAEHLPTNVSRSKLRDEALADVMRSVVSGLRRLVDAAGRALPDRAVEDALGVLALAYVRALQSGLASNEPGSTAYLDPLLDLPLLADGVGRSRGLRALASDRDVVVHAGNTPLHASFAPVCADLLWKRPDRPIDRLVTGVDHEAIARDTEAGAARAAEAMARPSTPFGLPADTVGVLRGRVTRADGFAAEISLRAPGGPSGDRQPRIQVWVDGRPYIQVDLRMETLPLDAAVSWPSVLEPDVRYTGLSRARSALREVEAALGPAVLDLVHQNGQTLVRDHAQVLRAWSELVARDWRAHPVLKLPIWPVAGGGAMSTGEMVTAIVANERFLWISPGAVSKDASLPDEPVFLLDAADLVALRAHLPAGVVATNCGSWLNRPRMNPDRVRAALVALCPGVPIVVSKDALGIVSAPSLRSFVLHMHRGEVVTKEAIKGTVSHAVEVDTLPRAHGSTIPLSEATLERAALDVVDAVLLAVDRGLDLETGGLREMITPLLLAHARARKSTGRLRRLNLFELVHGDVVERVSATTLCERIEGLVPWSSRRDAGDGPLVVIEESLVPLLERLTGRGARSVDNVFTAFVDSQPVHERLANLRKKLAREAASPPVAPPAPGADRLFTALPLTAPAEVAPARSLTEIPVVVLAPPRVVSLRDLFTGADGVVDPRARAALRVAETLHLSHVQIRTIEDGAAPMRFDSWATSLAIAHRHPVIATLIERGDAANLVAGVWTAVRGGDDASVVASLIDALPVLDHGSGADGS